LKTKWIYLAAATVAAMIGSGAFVAPGALSAPAKTTSMPLVASSAFSKPASDSTLYRKDGHPIMLCRWINCQPGDNWLIGLVRSGTPFTMTCWQDVSQYTNGTNRWFFGTAHTTVGSANGWVNANFVINQTKVPHC